MNTRLSILAALVLTLAAATAITSAAHAGRISGSTVGGATNPGPVTGDGN